MRAQGKYRDKERREKGGLRRGEVGNGRDQRGVRGEGRQGGEWNKWNKE